ncbi:uncharacterized protein LOC144747191 [Ciona intestinalis]
MNLVTKSRREWCSAASGLLGLCNNHTGNDFITRDGMEITTPEIEEEMLSQFAESWKVSATEGDQLLFNNNTCSIAYRGLLSSQSQYCLLFRGTIIKTQPIWSFSNYDITLEMDVKITATAGSRCFDVLSYNRDADISLKLRACVDDSSNQAFFRATYYSPNKNGLQSAHMLFDYQTTFRIYLIHGTAAMTWKQK